MNKSFKIIASLLLVFTCIHASAKEHIEHYHADIQIQQDRTVIITERIKVQVEGYIFKRGIFRDIPLSYTLKNGGKYHVGFDLLEVTKDGKQEPYKTERKSNGIRIYVGSADVFLNNGIYNYTIKYKVENVLSLFDQYDELSWNVNGNAWDVGIDSISANVYYPKQAGLVQTAVYTGAYGDTSNAANIYKTIGEVRFMGKQKLFPQDGMTVSVAWEKGYINYPTVVDQWIQKIQTFSLWIVGGLGLLFTLLFNTIFWWRKGRDPEKGIIIPQFSIPDDLTPADCAYIDNYYKYPDRAYGATIVGLAVKKVMTIVDEQEKKFLFTNRQKYIFTKLDSLAKNKEQLIEREFLDDLFGSTNQLEIVRKQYNANILKARNGLKANLKAKHEEKNIIRNTALTLKSWIIPFISLALGFYCFTRYGGNFGVIILLAAILTAISYLFSRWFQQPTDEGRKLMDFVAGIKQYIKYTEEDRLKIVNPPDFSFDHFEKILPYAIALDCADDWQHQFEVVNPEAARSANTFMWYHGTGAGSYKDFDFNDVSDTISSAAVPPTPTSSGGSGGGSFSGGGGFSGGGFGGGGGGGW